MTEIYHWVGNDLQLSASGGIQETSGVEASRQRIARRLITNPGDYIFHPEYGAGIPAYIGRLASQNEIKAVVLGQVLLESTVSKTTQPIVNVSQIAGTGNVTIDVTYTYAETGELATITVTV